MKLAITAIGRNRPEIPSELSQIVTDCNCNIVECRLTVLGRELATYLLIEGNWNHVAKLESMLDALSLRYNYKVNTCRTEEAKPDSGCIPYSIDAIAADRMAVMQELVTFLNERHIQIHDLTASRYPAPHTGAHIFAIHILIGIPSGLQLISLRDEFLDFCDRLNMDAILEPVKR